MVWLSYRRVTSLRRAALILHWGEVIRTRARVLLRSISIVWIWLLFCTAVWLLILIAGLLVSMVLFLRWIVTDPARRGR